MTLKSAIFSTTALVFLSSAASADVTAKDIWTDWKAYISGFGYTVDGTEAMSGDTLSVTDLALRVPVPEDGGDVTMSLGKVDFINVGDGTVRIEFPSVMPIRIKVTEGSEVDALVNYSMTGMDMVASGDPSKITYTYSAESIGMDLAELVVDGKSATDAAMVVNMTAADLKGTSVMEPGALRKIVQDMTLGATSYTVNFTDPDEGGSLALTGKMNSMRFDGNTVVPRQIDPDDMAAAMEQGFSVQGGFGYSGSETSFSFTEDGQVTSGTGSAEDVSFSVDMAKESLQYTGTSKGVTFNIGGGEIPLPVSLQMGEVGFNMLMPVAKSDTAKDFAFGLTLADIATSDALWSMLDPAAILPRDPATLAVDLSGKVKPLFDLFDPEEMEAVESGDALPAELEALTLNNLLVSIAGAKLSGTGDFTFDNSDTASFGGMPKPTGGVDLMLVGGMGLMDKLVEMGLLPQQQATGARMMLGLFARPGEGEDTLTSTIEITDDGQILANGQRIQ